MFLHGHIEHAPLLRAIAREAYASGARFVEVLYRDPHIKKALVDCGPEAALTHEPEWLRVLYDGLPGQAMIGVTGDPEPDLMRGTDQRRLGRARMMRLSELANRQFEEKLLNWCGVGYPNSGWAQTMFGTPDVERLWRLVAFCTRLDAPDPVAAWADHLAQLQRRADQLNELRPEALHFSGNGTDLRVGMLQSAHWVPVQFRTASGLPFVGNIPTEEVFTVPDRERIDGVVRTTRSVAVANTVVRGLRLEVAAGRIVRVDAESGGDVVRAQLDSDPSAAFFGEVALVDRDSRVNQTGQLFFDALFDENAACHVAYGDAIRDALDESDEPKANRSSLHTDLMIGAHDVNVDAVLHSETSIPLLRNDTWQLK